METRSHRSLKRLAVAFLRERGCLVAATEVRCPISRYRVDVAGYLDTRPRAGAPDLDGPSPALDRRRRRSPRTVFIECKRSRADYFRDRRDQEKLLRRRAALERLRGAIEERRIKPEEPALRRAGSSLFPELEEWDFAASRLPAYRQILRRLRRLDVMLHGETKFCMTARYALADRLYIAAPRGMLRPRELPPGWGLLECSRRALTDDDPNADLFGESRLAVSVPAPPLPTRNDFRDRLLRNIAIAASRDTARVLGVAGG